MILANTIQKKSDKSVKKNVENKKEEKEEKDPYITLDEINKCRIPRTYLEKWLNEPYFDDVVTKSFVRLSIGINPQTV